MSLTLGVISDTHGLLRPEAIKTLESCDAIIHAGDIGSEEALEELKAIAPTYAVRGNVDWEPWAMNIPVNDTIELAGRFFYMTHIFESIDLDPVSAGIDVVIFGHSHQPAIFRKKGVLYMNPGSAGPKRFSKPVSMGKIVIDDKEIRPEVIGLI